ncbi:MAG: MGMT family protein [Acidobacteriota bacterium]
MFEEMRRRVRRIPRGRVMTYGQVAEQAGYPRGARQVAWALRAFDAGLPWHRVIGQGGKVLLRGAKGVEQILRLEAEGVEVRGHRVDLKRFGIG